MAGFPSTHLREVQRIHEMQRSVDDGVNEDMTIQIVVCNTCKKEVESYEMRFIHGRVVPICTGCLNGGTLP